MDFAGCMEVFLGGAWHTFDPRNNAYEGSVESLSPAVVMREM